MNRRRSAEPLLWHAFTAIVILGLAWAFYVPALAKTGGLWPAPLDDVYIHFGFARSAALGQPFQWIPGNGFSSGGTSLTYPLLLAPGYLLGFHGASLGVFAALLACACLFDLSRSARTLVARAPRWVAWIAPPLLLAVPLLDWSLFSGMETALFYALLGRALVAVRQVEIAPPHLRSGAQIRAGIYCALLVATRPESVAVALPLGVAVAHAAGSLGTLSSLARGAGPTIAFLMINAAVNKLFTSEWGAAGAIRKLLTANPYTTPLDIAPEIVRNVIALRSMALESALGRAPYSMAVPLLAGLALLDRRSRRLALPLVIGAIGALLLAALNATARYQNLRYAAPSIAMLLLAALLGASSLASRRRFGSIAMPLSAALLAGAATIGPAIWFPTQIDHFARASANIAGQQVEVAVRLAALDPPPRLVLVGDAGAIPYISGIRAIDGLGLGGYRGMPFARASVHGIPAVVELIERLDPSERPDFMALYPSWWQGLADVFGRKIDAVKIADNVICAADEKVIYRADWAALELPGEARAGVVDRLDIADLIDERAHRYEAPVPRGGYVIGSVLYENDKNDKNAGAPTDRLRFDAGRIIPEGRAEIFSILPSVPRGPVELAMRTDEGGEVHLRIEVARGEAIVSTSQITVPARSSSSESSRSSKIAGSPGQWFEVKASLPDVAGGDRIHIFAAQGFWRSFHIWLLRRP